MKFIGIIPARYASTRFPGKPLADMNGKTMIQRVYEQVQNVLDLVYVATDDNRIETAVKSFGGNVVMTSDNHRSGTDRCYEAFCKIGKEYDVISVENGWFRIIDDTGEDYLFAPENFTVVEN